MLEILEFLIEKAKDMGYTEMVIGVDKDNRNALHYIKNTDLQKFCLTVQTKTVNIIN